MAGGSLGDLAALDATAQAQLVRSGEACPGDLVGAAIERVERLNPQLNAVIRPRFEQAREEAHGELPDGPFRGVPFLLKDLDGYGAGGPYHGGMRFLARHDFHPPVDSATVRQFTEAGLVCLGRTNCPELGLLPTTEPELYGPTHNPWDLDRSPGGSSGGSAAAVASGMVPFAHAGDGGGSIRIPASACGLVGLKPSRGRHSFGPELGEGWAGLVSRLVVSRSVRDTAGALDLVSGYLPGDPYTAPPPARPYVEEVGADPGRLRIGWRAVAPAGTTTTQAPCVAAVEQAAHLLADLGHDLEEASPAAFDEEGLVEHFTTCYTAWVAHELGHLAREVGAEVEPGDVEAATWSLAEAGKQVGAADYLLALDYLHGFSRRMVGWWHEGFDLLLTPTIAEPPTLLGSFGGDDPIVGLLRSVEVVAFTAPFNTTGQPAVSVPLYWEDGLPIGVQLVSAYGREDLLLRVAAQLEQARPWADRRPPVHASA